MKDKQAGLYLPLNAKVIDVIEMTSDVKLFRILPEMPFRYKPGQFVMVSLWGAGEVPISLTSAYGIHEYTELCIKRVGHVTTAIHFLKSGDKIGIRGPFGNGFSLNIAKGKDILFVAGGLGIAPLRPLMNEVIKNKGDFKWVEVIYGSRNPSEILFMDEINAWQKNGVHVILTVDKKDGKWRGNVGIVTEHLSKSRTSFKNAYTFICGPHIMIEAAMRELSSKGIREENIITTLESHMKCGVGKCGHCYANGRYICTDGPVFSYKEQKKSNLIV